VASSDGSGGSVSSGDGGHPSSRIGSSSGRGSGSAAGVSTGAAAAVWDYKVEVASAFWCRVVDRERGWSDVMRSLRPEQQVALAQRLGYCNVFDPVRPGMHYRLKMFRQDEYQVRWIRLRHVGELVCPYGPDTLGSC
jgi:hypothetical protein